VTTPDKAWTTYEQALQSLSESSPKLDAPALVLRLRKAFPNADVREVNLAVETFIARRQAPEKLGAWAKEGHFSVSLLQQASRESIATYRAQFFEGRSHVLEIGTGTGSDTAALARVALKSGLRVALLIALGTLVAGSVNWRQAAADLGVSDP
jgi:hypothetical protein